MLADTSPDGERGRLASERASNARGSLFIEAQAPPTEFAQYDTFEPFEPLEDEQLSRPSTAQSSRSQSPDNTDVDDSTALIEQFEKVDLGDSFATQELTSKSLHAPRKLHINDLPIDIMHEILHFLRTTSDMLAFMRVQRRWFGLAVPRLWFKPAIVKRDAFEKFCSILKMPAIAQMHPYAQHIARLNFTTVSRDVTNEHVLSLARCTSMKRLMLSHCRNVSSRAVEQVVENMRNLWMLDLDEVPIDDSSLGCIARSCPDLQVFYGDSDLISDDGLALLGRLGASLRRVRLKGCNLVTPQGVLSLALACPNLVELDVAELACLSSDKPQPIDMQRGFSNCDIRHILLGCDALRTLKISGSPRLTDSVLNLRGLRPLPRLSNLRELHLSCSSLITDAGVLQITQAAPRLRLLNLSRCVQITDRSLEYIACAHGSNLEYLHVGHCMNITDRGVITLTRYCHRLWFFDAANCTNLTDHAIVRLTRLRNLRRIGVVKCIGITDHSVLAISEGLPGVERLHLSYCAAITQYSVTRLLSRCRHIVHLSLTGVPAFMGEEIRGMGRLPPEDLSEHQRQVFCVFSQSGVAQLRRYLLEVVTVPTPLENAEQARRRRLNHMHAAEMPIDQLGPEEIAEIAWLRDQNFRGSLPDQVDQTQPTTEVWTNPNMLPIRDGLVRFGPRNPSDVEQQAQQQAQFYREILAFNDRLLVRMNHSIENQERAGDEADEMINMHQEYLAAGESRIDQERESDAAQEGTPVAELRARRFRFSFRPRSAPTGPLEGTGLPPQ